MGSDDHDRGKPSDQEPHMPSQPLAPLEGDELFEMPVASLADFIDADLDSGLDDAGLIPQDDPTFALDDDAAQSSWLDDGAEEVPLDFSLLMDDRELTWTEGEGETARDSALDWLDLDEIPPETGLDDGAEGPEHEIFDIDDSAWERAETESELEPEEDILETMDRLGMSVDDIAAPADTPMPVGSAPSLIDSSFLGPMTGDITAVMFDGESPIAVGDGFFVLGADEMLHGAASSLRLCDLYATSICGTGQSIFIGTQRGGAFVTRDKGSTITPINGWYTHGFAAHDGIPLEEFSTGFSVFCQQFRSGPPVLLGCTGEGQLFLSLDEGVQWEGPILKGRCASPMKSAGLHAVMAIIDSPGYGMRLCRSHDLVEWQPLELPGALSAHLELGELSFSANGRTVLVSATDPAIPLFRTRDDGATWSAVEGLSDVTAATIDPEDPSFMAVGTLENERTAARVRVSENSGETWQTALKIPVHRPVTGSEPAQLSHVRDLVVTGRRTRLVLVRTEQGVYWIRLARRNLAH